MRYELIDYEWLVIKPLLPNKLGGPRLDDRRVLKMRPIFAAGSHMESLLIQLATPAAFELATFSLEAKRPTLSLVALTDPSGARVPVASPMLPPEPPHINRTRRLSQALVQYWSRQAPNVESTASANVLNANTRGHSPRGCGIAGRAVQAVSPGVRSCGCSG
jgi:hypothetical protein